MPAKAVSAGCLERGLMLPCDPWDNTVPWIPPLVVTSEQIDRCISIFADALAEAAHGA